MILWILAAIVVFAGGGIWLFLREDPDYIVKLIKENAPSKKGALTINYNNESWVKVNENEPLPLASTMKIIIAIEYAHQAAKGEIDPQQKVRLSELANYYVPKTDGGAHEAWLKSVTKAKEEDEVPLSEIANGMIAYSSNANTDYLIKVLGIENINNLLHEIGATNHEPIYPVVSSLFIPVQLTAEEQLSCEEALEVLKKMDITEYRLRALKIHQNWLENPPTTEEKEQIIKSLNMDYQRLWSDQLPRAAAQDYLALMKKINSKTFFDKEVHHYLDLVLEQVMKNPKNREWLEHAGQKGGSTAFVFTISMYAKDVDGNQTELVFLADDLNMLQQIKLRRNMNGFQLKFLRDDKFRLKVKQSLAERN
ncbi:class A beta-lactamase-related serine hydrolase [Mesobacillus maritimus]|uniref:serine hydrolase n=1 Tax=Mesobacillus maritimus TaxID=1643336 RepID=UPI00203A6A9D|nr:class A beta-lactamase-related serine hydrolase [Mesobacillus maritimus]